MVDNKLVSFILKIIQQTKEKKMEWKYLDENRTLYEGMGWANKKVNYGFFSPTTETITPNFNIEDSFFTRIGDMCIVIYVRNDTPASLFVVPNTYKKVVVLTPDEYGDYITQLLNLVESQFPNAESFIDDFLDEKSVDGNNG